MAKPSAYYRIMHAGSARAPCSIFTIDEHQANSIFPFRRSEQRIRSIAAEPMLAQLLLLLIIKNGRGLKICVGLRVKREMR